MACPLTSVAGTASRRGEARGRGRGGEQDGGERGGWGGAGWGGASLDRDATSAGAHVVRL